MATDKPQNSCNAQITESVVDKPKDTASNDEEIPDLIPYEQWTSVFADPGDPNMYRRSLSPENSESKFLCKNDRDFQLRTAAAQEIAQAFATHKKGTVRICYTHGENSLSRRYQSRYLLKSMLSLYSTLVAILLSSYSTTVAIYKDM
ncbi:hypothetical protein BT96DRAFT_937625 [Gymnopus androsaceus JB14]|uniref:Uncharacterized protein n=1 Tax=Gymnopus androsaceus JB14 TaxID=1447944 RepID=A0A6A4HYR4_9AGAR|nr:hypothetical protein BT96DRAFT_937625 [Gymnopus androsaceus JB14]